MRANPSMPDGEHLDKDLVLLPTTASKQSRTLCLIVTQLSLSRCLASTSLAERMTLIEPKTNHSTIRYGELVGLRHSGRSRAGVAQKQAFGSIDSWERQPRSEGRQPRGREEGLPASHRPVHRASVILLVKADLLCKIRTLPRPRRIWH